jgi:hypothetical protein
MARSIGKLNAMAITQAKRRGYYGDEGGLFLQVSIGDRSRMPRGVVLSAGLLGGTS